MTRHVMRLPDLGEGTVSAEVIAWKVAPGDVIREDAPLVEMSTEKAVVEVPSPVSGRVVALGGKPGDVIAVGAELAVFELDSSAVSAAPAVAARRAVHALESAIIAPAGASPVARRYAGFCRHAARRAGPPPQAHDGGRHGE